MRSFKTNKEKLQKKDIPRGFPQIKGGEDLMFHDFNRRRPDLRGDLVRPIHDYR